MGENSWLCMSNEVAGWVRGEVGLISVRVANGLFWQAFWLVFSALLLWLQILEITLLTQIQL